MNPNNWQNGNVANNLHPDNAEPMNLHQPAQHHPPHPQQNAPQAPPPYPPQQAPVNLAPPIPVDMVLPRRHLHVPPPEHLPVHFRHVQYDAHGRPNGMLPPVLPPDHPHYNHGIRVAIRQRDREMPQIEVFRNGIPVNFQVRVRYRHEHDPTIPDENQVSTTNNLVFVPNPPHMHVDPQDPVTSTPPVSRTLEPKLVPLSHSELTEEIGELLELGFESYNELYQHLQQAEIVALYGEPRLVGTRVEHTYSDPTEEELTSNEAEAIIYDN